MQPFYILCLAAAFSLFLWQSVSDARQSVVQQTMLLVIIISNGGYAALAGAENLREAVLATKVLYTGACFLPMLYFITMCEVCRVHLSRFLLAGMTLLQTLLFGFVCTIGHNDLFYKAICTVLCFLICVVATILGAEDAPFFQHMGKQNFCCCFLFGKESAKLFLGQTGIQ